jgi:D-alanine-D-alanine ligase
VAPGELSPELEAHLKTTAEVIFEAFECRDFARIDFRMDAAGKATFLELNPLPTFAPDGTFGVLAELEGRPVAALLAEVLEQALRRIGLPGHGRPFTDIGD